jgi:hypothetical protein
MCFNSSYCSSVTSSCSLFVCDNVMLFVRLRQETKRERVKIQSDKRHRNKRQTDKIVCDTKFYNYNLEHYVRKSQMDVDDIDPCLCYSWSLRDGKCIGLCELPSYSLRTSLNMARNERGAAPASDKVLETDLKITPVRRSRRTRPSHRAPALPTNTGRVPLNQRWFYEPVGPSTTIAPDSSSVVIPK